MRVPIQQLEQTRPPPETPQPPNPKRVMYSCTKRVPNRTKSKKEKRKKEKSSIAYHHYKIKLNYQELISINIPECSFILYIYGL